MNKAIKRSLYIGLSLLMAASVAGPSTANAAHHHSHIHVNRRYVSRKGLLKDIAYNLRKSGKVSANRKISTRRRNVEARFYLNRANRDYVQLSEIGYNRRNLRSIKGAISNNYKILKHPAKKVRLSKKAKKEVSPVNAYFRLGSASGVVSPHEYETGGIEPTVRYVPYWFNFHVYRAGIGNKKSFSQDTHISPNKITLGDVEADLPWLETGTASTTCPSGYGIYKVYNPVANNVDNPYQSDYKFVLTQSRGKKSRTLAVDLPSNPRRPSDQKFLNIRGQRENYLPLYGRYPEMIVDRNVNHYSNQDKWYHQGLYIGKLGHWEGIPGQENYFLINMGDPGSDNWNSNRPYKHVKNITDNQHTYRITRNDYLYLRSNANRLRISDANEDHKDGIHANGVQGEYQTGHAHLGNYYYGSNNYNY